MIIKSMHHDDVVTVQQVGVMVGVPRLWSVLQKTRKLEFSQNSPEILPNI
jgi:hypothetical protein